MNRRRLLLLWAVLVVLAWSLPHLLPQAAAEFPEESQSTLRYEIEATLDATSHEIASWGVLTWRNDSDVEVPEMRMHLYLNAFKNELSTFMRESGGSHRGHKFDKTSPGWIKLTSFKRRGGEELLPADPADYDYVHEDDGNTDDETVIRIPLKKAIAAKEEAVFELTWTSRMPKVFARTGQGGNGAFFMVAQWFPKPGVWEIDPEKPDAGYAWNCHQFHGSSEFYADYGTYDVRITVPKQFVGKVGASGRRVDEAGKASEDPIAQGEDGSATYRHIVEHVHDFAWVCGEDFEVHPVTFEGGAGVDEEEQRRVARIMGVPPSALNLPEVTVYILLQPEHADQLERHKNAVFNALTYMGFWYGPYPYPTLTVVDPDHRGRDAGGMEYPTLITGGTRYVRAAKQTSPEGVLVHEFGHQHFYGLLGSNEFRHAWMDEGMCTFATGKVLTKAYDGYTSATWYAGYPHYGERPFEFGGLLASSRKAVPWVEPLFDETLEVPFGSLGIIKSIAGAFGAEHPPETISLWADGTELTPLSYLREMPLLTHLRPRASSTKEYERTANARTPTTDPIAGRRAWEYMNRRSYGTNSYRRTASSLRTIEGFLGEETMVKAMRTYCQEQRFKHPRPKDFYDSIVKTAELEGKGDIRWLLDELFERATTFDFGIATIDAYPLPDLSLEEDEDKETQFESTVLVRRFGGVRMPIDIRLRFKDGSVRDFLWDRNDDLFEYAMSLDTETGRWVRGELGGDPLGPLAGELSRVTPARGEQQRWARIRIRGPQKVRSAEVDPFYAYSLDRDRTNDGFSRKKNRGPALQIALRALGWVELSNSFYGGL